jgi:hypothetical protein
MGIRRFIVLHLCLLFCPCPPFAPACPAMPTFLCETSLLVEFVSEYVAKKRWWKRTLRASKTAPNGGFGRFLSIFLTQMSLKIQLFIGFLNKHISVRSSNEYTFYPFAWDFSKLSTLCPPLKLLTIRLIRWKLIHFITDCWIPPCRPRPRLTAQCPSRTRGGAPSSTWPRWRDTRTIEERCMRNVVEAPVYMQQGQVCLRVGGGQGRGRVLVRRSAAVTLAGKINIFQYCLIQIY